MSVWPRRCEERRYWPSAGNPASVQENELEADLPRAAVAKHRRSGALCALVGLIHRLTAAFLLGAGIFIIHYWLGSILPVR